MAHVMTHEELSECCEKSSIFLRFNIDLIPYSYLKKYKNKTAFKEIVGDRRNSSNSYFGQKLYDKLNVDNSLDFIFSDEGE
jgi:hypothetical protein